uniref:Uncharacterized protein n=1 Tax=Oryza glumipatula TaxID=40148 RepID=A0A0E0AN17_9ORYZ
MAVKKTMKVVFSLVLLLLPLASTSAVEVKFDFMYFVQQWAPSYCSTAPHECEYEPRPPPNNFTIRGLWPSYEEWRPEYCNISDRLDPGQIEDLVNPLNQSWPSLLRNETNLELWSHEWEKHGTCSNLSQHGYFAAALALDTLTNLTGILADGGVVPSDEKTYTLGEISDALARGTGFTTYLRCSQDERNYGETLLYEVLQCVDRSGERLVNCTAPWVTRCLDPDKIKIPAWFYGQ